MRFGISLFSFLSMGLLLYSHNGYAEAPQHLLKVCSELEDNKMRLECYDSLLRAPASPPSKKSSTRNILQSGNSKTLESKNLPSGEMGNWQQRIDEEKINGKKYYLTLDSENTFSNAIGHDERSTLIIRCVNNQTDAFFTTPYVSSDGQTIKYKVDSNPTKSMWVNAASDGGALFISRPIDFIKKNMIGKRALIFSFTPYGKTATEIDFDIKAMDEAIKPLRQQCKW